MNQWETNHVHHYQHANIEGIIPMGTSALPEVLPIGVILYVAGYMAFCLVANIFAEKEDNHE